MFTSQLFSALALMAIALTHDATAQLYAGTYSYSSHNACTGAYVFCPSYREGICCKNPDDYGYSVGIKLPLAAEIEGFKGNSCSLGGAFAAFGPGYKCTNSGGLWRANSTKWTYSQLQKTAVELDSGDTADAECISPTVFGYETDKGVLREIKIPVGVANATDTLTALYLAKDFETLKKYKTHYCRDAKGKPASHRLFCPSFND